ncbi:MAG: DsrE/DsrF/DrsH-like family protein [Ornithinimicrobium sp.]
MTTTTTLQEQPLVPDFGEEADTDRKLVIICSKGNLDMAYPALVLANASLGEGIETHLFFTFWGFDMINKETMQDLKFTPVGNTAMHIEQAASVRPGWRWKSVPQSLTGLPGMTWLATRMMRKQIADLDIPTVPEMLEQIVAMGGQLWACKMSFDMQHLSEEDLYEGVGGVISAADFMDLSQDGQLLFV